MDKKNEIDTDVKNKQKATLRVAVTTAFITTFMGSALNLAIPDLGAYYHTSAAFIGWIVTAYMLAVATMSVPFGKIADMTGRRRILILGIFFFSFTSLTAIVAPNIYIMIMFRVIQGTSGAMIFATNTAILISAFPEDKRGEVLGKMTASTYVGLSAGPVLGGLLNHNFGWQSIFITTAAVGFFALITAIRRLPKKEHLVTETKHDYAGNIFYVIMIVLTMYGISNITSMKFGWCCIAAGITAGIIFVRVELKAKNPVIQVRIFVKNMIYTLSNLAALLNYGATFAIGYLMSIYLQVVMGYSSQTAGIILIAQPAVMAFLSPVTGRLSDKKVEPYKLASAGMGVCSLCLLFFAYISADTPLWAIIAVLFCTGIGFALFSSPNTNAVMACVPQEKYSIASSILATMRSLGHTSSMAVVTMIVSVYLGSKGLENAEPDLLIETMHVAFLVFTGLCIAGLFMSLKRKKPAK